MGGTVGCVKTQGCRENTTVSGQLWGCMPVILALRMLRQGDHVFEAILSYIVSSRPV